MKLYTNLAVIVLLVTAMGACKTSNKTMTTAAPAGEKPKVQKYFTIDQGPCFGRCAVYEISLLSDSTIRLNGKKYINYEGNYMMKLTGNQFDSLLDIYRTIKLDTFKNQYTNNIVDLAAVTYYFFDDYNSVKKKILTHGLYPTPLANLSSAIRIYIGRVGWQADTEASTVNPDELIVQIKEGQNIQNVVDDNWRYKLFIKQELSKSGIYLIGFDKTTIDQNQLINVLKANPAVMLVEKNNKVELRSK